MGALPCGRALNGPSTIKTMAHVTLKGSSYQRGLQYGKAFGRHLKDFYYWFAKKEPCDWLSDGNYRELLESLEEATAEHLPQLLEQIKGWSDGAGLPYDMCRILGFHNEIKSVLRPGCCNIICVSGPSGPWLAHNQDVHESERSWQVHRTCYCDDCQSHTNIGYLGLPGGTGVNSAGLAIGGASLPGPTPARTGPGFPNLSTYLLLSQTSVSSCCESIKRLGHAGKGIHAALLDATGDAAVVELAGGKRHVRRPNAVGVLIATNHSPSGQTQQPTPVLPADLEQAQKEAGRQLDILDNSWARYSRLMELVCSATAPDRTPELARKALGDHWGKHTVCQHRPEGFQTVASIVICPGVESSLVRLCWGNPCSAAFTASEFPEAITW